MRPMGRPRTDIMAPSNKHAECPSCGSTLVSEIGDLPASSWFAGARTDDPIPGGALYDCKQCHLRFRYPLCEAVVTGELYNNSTTDTWRVDTLRQDHDLICRYVEKSVPSQGRVLDYGCYTGDLLARLGDSYLPYGLEVNVAAAAVARERLCCDIFSSPDEIPSDLLFDVIIVADVAEHLVDPGQLLQELKALLEPGGAIVITTGDAENRLWRWFGPNWWYCFYPEHISFLSRAWLENAAEAHALRMSRCDTFRYRSTGFPRRALDSLQTFAYGLIPRAYLALVTALRRLRGPREVTSVPGAGVSKDHIFVVLENTKRNV